MHLLLVEDNHADADLIRDTLEVSKIKVELEHVDDGEKALAYLLRRSPYQAARKPDLIVLDLNLPKLNGRELLAEIRGDEQLKFIPVVILTSSDAEQDIVKSYVLGANCYVTKPIGLTEFQTIVNSIENFWFSVVRLP